MHKTAPWPLNVKCKLTKKTNQQVCLLLVTKAQPGLRTRQSCVWHASIELPSIQTALCPASISDFKSQVFTRLRLRQQPNGWACSTWLRQVLQRWFQLAAAKSCQRTWRRQSNMKTTKEGKKCMLAADPGLHTGQLLSVSGHAGANAPGAASCLVKSLHPLSRGQHELPPGVRDYAPAPVCGAQTRPTLVMAAAAAAPRSV